MTEEKLELLKRSEVKTMEKDLFRLREEEAKKEREKIMGLKTKEEKISEVPIKKEKFPKKFLITRPTFRPLSTSEKIFIRVISIVIIILFFVGIFTFWYWYSRETEKISYLPLLPSPTPVEEEIFTPTPEATPELTPVIEVTPTPIVFSIIDKLVTWGFYIPKKSRIIDTIIIHSIYNDLDEEVYNIEKIIEKYKENKVTSHYLIDRDGAIYHLAPDKAIAYHAGSGQMPDGSRKNIINNFSIGIELVYTKEEFPTEIQYQALVFLVKNLQQQYNIPLQNILGHKDINPQKTDPWNFDWEKFRELLK